MQSQTQRQLQSKTGVRALTSAAMSAVLMLSAIFATSATPTAYAATEAGVVGDGTPGSCTETAVINALSGGGTVRFNCGPAPLTIAFTSSKTIGANTILDGGNLITLSGNNVTRLFVVNSNIAFTVKNIAIANGSASGDGGAIYNSIGATLQVDNSRFYGNHSTAASGGAIVSYGPLTVTNSVFEQNGAVNGGAIYPRWTAGKTWIVSSVLRNNSATDPVNGWGGAMLIWDGASVEISDSEFANNDAREGGAIYLTANSSLNIRASAFQNNTAIENGGAIQSYAQMTIADSAVLTNTSDVAGAIANYGGTLRVQNTRLAYNIASNTDSMGGAILNSAGDTRILSSTLEYNQAARGGAIQSDGQLSIENSTLYSNTATLRGGGFLQEGGVITLSQVTLAANNAATHGGGFYKSGGALQGNFVTIVSNTAAVDGGNIYFDLTQGDTSTFEGSLFAGTDCAGDAVTSAGYNIDSGNTCGLTQSTDKTNTDPRLQEIGDNGGTDWTQVPAPDSAAVNAYAGSRCPAFDQRGFPRPAGAACDLGAVEAGAVNAAVNVNVRVNDADDFAAIGGRLLWLKQADCSTGNSEQSISRIAINGGVPAREVYVQDDVCGDPNVVPRSNLVADDDFIFWMTNQGVMRQSTRANADDAPQVFFDGMTGVAELGMSPDFLLVVQNGNVTLINKQTKAVTNIADGAARKPSGTKTSSGHFMYWLSGTQLKRYNIGNGQTDVADGNATAYKAIGARQHCYGGNAAQCKQGDFVFIGNGTQVKAYDNLTGQSEVIYQSTGKNIYDISFDGDTLVTSEEETDKGLLINSVIAKPQIGLINSTSPGAKPLYISPAASVRTIGSLKVSDGYALWQVKDRINQICLACLMIKPNISITGIEVTQGIQTPDNSVVLVKNRDTWVRVHVKSDSLLAGPIAGVTAQLKVYGNSLLGTLQPIAPSANVLGSLNVVGGIGGLFGTGIKVVNTGRTITVQPNPDRANLDQSFLFSVPRAWTNSTASGLLAFAAEVNPAHTIDERTYDDNKLMKGLTFYSSGRLQVQFVVWGYSLPGTTAQIFPSQTNDIDPTFSYIRRTYPVASTVADSSSNTPGFRPGTWTIFDAGMGSRVDQSFADCKDRTVFIPFINITIPVKGDGNLCAARYSNRRMAELRTQNGLADNIFMYGMISTNGGANFARGEATGSSSTGPAGPPSGSGYNWDTDTTFGDWYAAHEIGHSLGRPHPFTGSLSDTNRLNGQCRPTDNGRWGVADGGLDMGYTHPHAQIGADNNTLGFDPGYRALSGLVTLGRSYQTYPGAQWYDFMSYCNGQWISDYTYWQLYTRLRPSLVADASIAQAQPDTQPAAQPNSSEAVQMPAAPLVGDWLLVQGDIQPDGASAFVATTKKLNAVGMMPARVPGNYAIQLLDSNSAVLADYAFTPDEPDEGSRKRAFTQVVTNVLGTRAIRIVTKPAGAVIGGQQLSDNAPMVSNVQVQNPNAGTATLTWSAADPDNDALSFDVYYSNNGGATLLPLRLNVSGSTTAIDMTQLPGGSAIFRVIATDGTFVVQADSAPVSLSMKPPMPQIDTPDNVVVNVGEVVNFIGRADDPQDGALTGGSLVWSNAGGVMGVGDALPFGDLAVGAQVITLTATNSKGLSASRAITVVVNDDLSLPGPTISIMPNQLSFSIPKENLAPQNQVIKISNAGSGTLNWTAATTATWLSLSAAGGAAPANLTVTANPAGVPNGTTLNGIVVLQTTNNGTTQRVEVPVSMAVGFEPLQGSGGTSGPSSTKLFLPLVRR